MVFNSYYQGDFIGEVSAPSQLKAEEFVIEQLAEQLNCDPSCVALDVAVALAK